MVHARCNVPLMHWVTNIGLREPSLLLLVSLPRRRGHLHPNIVHLHLNSLRLLLPIELLLLESGLSLVLRKLAKHLLTPTRKKRGSAKAAGESGLPSAEMYRLTLVRLAGEISSSSRERFCCMLLGELNMVRVCLCV